MVEVKAFGWILLFWISDHLLDLVPYERLSPMEGNCMFSLNFDIYCSTVQPSRFRRDSPDLASKLIPNPNQSVIRIGKNPDFFTYVLIFSNEFL